MDALSDYTACDSGKNVHERPSAIWTSLLVVDLAIVIRAPAIENEQILKATALDA
jgi:hypothetical protein